jgi:hypothetical protein
MPRRYRSLVPPAALILAFTAGGAGCDTEARRLARAEDARRNQAWEDGQRRKAETEPPTPEVQEQVKAATQSFMEQHHADLLVEGTTFTPLTPNLFLVGVSVKDLLHENRYVAQLTAERMRDVTWGEGEEPRENGQLLWVIDYADAAKMAVLAQRHGFAQEVDRIRDQDREGRYATSWGQRSWLDNYLIWHMLFNRPSSYGYRAGSGFAPMAPGYRFQDPAHPIMAPDAQRFQAAAAPTGGRSMVFLGGSAWRPPLVSSAASLPGQAFVAGRGGTIAGHAAMGSVSRGGFGAAGHASGSGG